MIPLGNTSREGARAARLTRRLREIMNDTLPRQLPELAVPTPGAQPLSIILQHREDRFTHASLIVRIIVKTSVMSLLEAVMLFVFDQRSSVSLSALLTEHPPRVICICTQTLQVIGVPPIDLQPDVAIPFPLGCQVNVFDR